MNNTLNTIESTHTIQINEVSNEQRLEVKKREYQQKWYQKNKEKKQEDNKSCYQENKIKILETNKRWYQDNKEKMQKYRKKQYQLNKAKKQEQKQKKDDYHFDVKQNFELNSESLSINSEFDLSFAVDGRYDEQIIKNAWNILEPEQLSLLNQTIDQALDSNELLAQNTELLINKFL